VKVVVASFVAIAAILTSACGDGGEDDDADDPRRAEIGGVAELAIGAYASAGPEALADYMSAGALQRCPQSRLADALADQPVPTGFRQLRNVDFDSDSVTATIIISTREGEEDIIWTYVDEDGSWRIDDMPGIEDCA
jgi:hypothetical protein